MRELRGGLKGFRIFIACLALGVMVIAAVGALADALRAGLASQGETILGGDVTFARMHTRATPAEQDVLRELGHVSETATLRTMARRLDGSDQALVELKAVDAAYPLTGEATVEGGTAFADAIAGNGVVADSMLLERLGLKVGDNLRIGEAEITVRGALKVEPDAVADRLTYGPRIFASLATLDRTALVKPGTLIRWRYAIKLRDGLPKDRDALAALRKSLCPKAACRRLHQCRPLRSLAADHADARAAQAIPHPHRTCIAPGRWRRHRECRCDVHRQAREGHCHVAQRRRHRLADLRHFPHSDPADERHWYSHRSRIRHCRAASDR